MRILYIGPLRDSSGYAEAARNYVSALISVGADVAARAIKFDAINHELTVDQEKAMAKPVDNIDVVIQHTTPNTTAIKQGVPNILYMAWETTLLPESWPPQINKFNAVMVPCEANVKALKDSGVTIPIYKVPHAFDLSSYNRPVENMKVGKFKDLFVFYNVCQLSKKKGIDRLLISYLTEFKRSENVALFLKTYVNANFGKNDTAYVSEYVNKIKQGLKLKEYPPIFVNTQMMPDDQILSIHKSLDCCVAVSRAEGFNIPAFDAMACGTPTIVTGWGGFDEYKAGCIPVDYAMEPVFGQDHSLQEYYTGRELWAVPAIMSIRNAMRNVYENEGIRRVVSEDGKKIAESFTFDKIGRQMLGVIEEVYAKNH